MKYRELLLEQLKSLPHFDKRAFYQLSKQYGIKEATIDAYISRSLARRDIVQLKKGMYIAASFYEKNAADISYTFYLASVLRTPSYISLWSALQYYDLATEATHGITSVTMKVTREYRTRAGTFSYHSIKEALFSGFSLVTGTFDFFIASPSKALFDVFYFKTRQFRGVTFKMVRRLIDDLRVDIDEMDKKERAAFYTMIKKYTP